MVGEKEGDELLVWPFSSVPRLPVPALGQGAREQDAGWPWRLTEGLWGDHELRGTGALSASLPEAL